MTAARSRARLLFVLATSLAVLTALFAVSPVAADHEAEAGLVMVVNSTGDRPDDVSGDDLCDTGATIGEDPECTLRAAVQQANAHPNTEGFPDVIQFNIDPDLNNCDENGVCTIGVRESFPCFSEGGMTLPGGASMRGYFGGGGCFSFTPFRVTEAVVIDGYTQPGSSGNTLAVGNDAQIKIRIDGEGGGLIVGSATLASANTLERPLYHVDNFDSCLVLDYDGLEGDSSGSIIAGLSFTNCPQDAIIVRSNNNNFYGNWIGLDPTGTAGAMGNGGAGIWIDPGSNIEGVSGGNANNIGGVEPWMRNVISNNGHGGNVVRAGLPGENTSHNDAGVVIGTDEWRHCNGLCFEGTPNIGPSDIATGNTIYNNYIGTDAFGTGALGNEGQGILLLNAVSTLIGDEFAGSGNVISGSIRDEAEEFPDGHGIFLANSDGNTIQGNLIGTNAAGTGDLGNEEDGIHTFQSSSNHILQNVIAGNEGDGIELEGPEVEGEVEPEVHESAGNIVDGNTIGFSPELRNEEHGVLIDDEEAANQIGFHAAEGGMGNVIVWNVLDGVHLTNDAGDGNSIRGNSIESNGELGIDLVPPEEVEEPRSVEPQVVDESPEDEVTANDDMDPDVGPNELQNFPVLSFAESDVAGTTIEGSLNTTPEQPNLVVDFYWSAECDPSGFGEGAVWLTGIPAEADVDGNVEFSEFLADVHLGPGFVTATATDLNTEDGNTSEFSECFAVTVIVPPSGSPPVSPPASGSGAPGVASPTRSALPNTSDPAAVGTIAVVGFTGLLLVGSLIAMAAPRFAQRRRTAR